MTEELHDVRLVVNGVAHDLRLPARRLLSDALRHDLGLTGTHVGCEHGVCGACTVLVDGRPDRSCLMFAVSAVDCEITTVEGLTRPDGSLGPVQQAFLECHGLQCGFCTPGFLTTVTAGLRDQPDADRGRRPRDGRRQPVSLHRLHEHREVRAPRRCVGRGGCAATVASPRDRGALMTTKLFGQKVQRVEDQRFLRGEGRYVDDVAVGQDVLHAAVLRSPHAHARIVDIDVSGVLDLDGVHLVWTHDDLTGPMAEPLPLLIPHPALTHGRTQFALARDEVNHVGEAIAFVVADDRYVAEDAVGQDPGRRTTCCRRWSASRRRAPRPGWCTTTYPATSRPGSSRRTATPARRSRPRPTR